VLCRMFGCLQGAPQVEVSVTEAVVVQCVAQRGQSPALSVPHSQGERERRGEKGWDSGRAELIDMRRAPLANGQTGSRECQDPAGSD
ncbi:hypothetical protein JOQ06_002830, partial [Pogonophryne albipinna]